MPSTPPTILLIDDDPDMHAAVRMMLEPLGYQLECHLTGVAGMEAMQLRIPDVLLLDIMLSSPSEGFHIAYEMQNDERLREVPIIMLSAIGRATGIDYAREIGSAYVPAQSFLDKPFSAETLRSAVAEALRRKAGAA